MNYFDLPCPVCSEVMKKGDDIVVCPECATPHHRECWFKNGHCINQDLHADGFVWTPDGAKANTAASAEDVKTEAETENKSDNVSPDSIVCHICGSENPADALHCGSCGALFGETAEDVPQIDCPFCGAKNPENATRCQGCGNFIAATAGNPFMNGVDMDENDKLGEYTAGDYAMFTQLNAKRYIPKFRKIEEKKITFNWAAFFFGAKWFLFRKMYKIGIILIIAFASISMMTAPLRIQFLNASEEFYAKLYSSSATEGSTSSEETVTEPVTQENFEEAIQDYLDKTKIPSLVLAAIWLAQSLVCGFIADKFYYKKINSDLKIIDEAVDNNGIRKMMIVRRGSVSFLAYFAGNLGEQVLLNLFIIAAEKLSAIL